MPPETQEIDPQTAVCVGRVVGAHGLRGEVRVEPLTDFPERFEAGSVLWLDGAPRRVEASRWRGRSVYLKLDGASSRTEAAALRGKELMAPEPRPIEEAGRYYRHDVVGLRVEDEAGAALGRVADILVTGANDVYVVRGEQGELLLPAIEDVVREVDVAGGRLVVALLPGLEFVKPGKASPRRPKRGTGAKPPSAGSGRSPTGGLGGDPQSNATNLLV